MNCTDLDLLTVLIGNRQKAIKIIAKAKFSLFTLLHSQPQENGDLFCAEGSSAYGDQPAMKLQAAMELATRTLMEELQTRSSLTSPGAVRDLLRLKLAGLPHEVFVCIQLDAQHRVIAIEELFRGTLTQTSVYPREVVKASLRANAAAVIFAHNHPSGAAQPSQADELLTRNLGAGRAVRPPQGADAAQDGPAVEQGRGQEASVRLRRRQSPYGARREFFHEIPGVTDYRRLPRKGSMVGGRLLSRFARGVMRRAFSSLPLL